MVTYISDIKMGATKKSKKATESINSRLGLVMKSGSNSIISKIYFKNDLLCSCYRKFTPQIIFLIA